MKKRIFILAFTLILAASVFGGYWGVYQWELDKERRYSHKVSPPKEATYPYLTARQTLNLGWAQVEEEKPKSSFMNFSKEKPAGIKRIGIFGGSFTEGSETCNGNDFPSHLQRMLDEYFPGQYQVLNFGVSGYGLHQSYLLWQYVGRAYDIDLAIYNLYRMHLDRDNTFRLYFLYEPIHARFIVEEDSLKLIEVLGKDRKDAVRIYHSFFQPEHYYKYDVRVPNFLKPVSRKNPYYYNVDIEGEKMLTYRKVFENWAAEVPDLLILDNNELLTDMKLPENVRLSTATSGIRDKHPLMVYQAPNGHTSAMGNRWVAAGVFQVVTDTVYSLPVYIAHIAGMAFHTGINTGSVNLVPMYADELGRFYSKKDDPFFSKPADISGRRYIWLPDFMGELTLLPVANNVKHGDAIKMFVNDTLVRTDHICISDKGLGFVLDDSPMFGKKVSCPVGEFKWSLPPGRPMERYNQLTSPYWNGMFYIGYEPWKNAKARLEIGPDIIPMVTRIDPKGNAMFVIDTAEVVYFRLNCDQLLDAPEIQLYLNDSSEAPLVYLMDYRNEFVR